MIEGNILPHGVKCHRVRTLRDINGYTQAFVAEKLGCNLRAYRNWELGDLETEAPISSDHLHDLAKFYNVSTDYLLGLSDYTHVENEAISKITGLSDHSIEVLRYLNSREKNDFDATTVFNHEIIDAVNMLLEESYESVQKSQREVASGGFHRLISSLFSSIFNYVHSDEAHSENEISDDFFEFKFKDHTHIVGASEMYRQVMLNQITHYLDYLRKAGETDEK